MGYAVELTKLGINLRGRTSGQLKTSCPSGKHKGVDDLSVNIDEGIYLCHSVKCDFHGTVKPTYKKIDERVYKKPQWVNKTELTEGWVQYWAARGLSQDTLNNAHLTIKDKWCCFPFFRNEEVINVQMRSMDKQFRMVPGAEIIFYNQNALYEFPDVVITEGQVDTLSYIEAGVKNVVSVPNGANIGSMDYLNEVWERIEAMERIYLSVDNDEPGEALKKELARRIGADKCWLIDLGDCKDANEFLVKYGKEELRKAYENAQPYPIEGIIYAADEVENVHTLYREGLKQGALTGIMELDNVISFEPGYTTVIHGIPSHGKSTWVDMLVTRLCLMDPKGKVGVFSPENYPVSRHISRLASKLIGKPFFGYERMTEDELLDAERYINQRFFFINQESHTDIDSILERARLLVLRYGIKFLIIDPYNRLDSGIKTDGKDNMVEYTLKAITKFNRMYGCHTFMVVHPRKMQRKQDTNKYIIPVMYDVNGSSDWFNMADIGICIYRDGDTTEVHIQKRRFEHWGKMSVGSEAIVMHYNILNGRFYTQEIDNKNWLKNPIINQMPDEQLF